MIEPPALTKRILDADIAAVGLVKTDDRGCTVCLHGLRHTFSTMLSRGGVNPPTAQAAMRHGSIALGAARAASSASNR